MSQERKNAIETIALHEGQTVDRDSQSRAIPIYQTSAYVFNDAAQAAARFGLKDFGNIYARLTNTTTDFLEKRLAGLDGGTGALAVSSGQAAITLAVLNITQAGQNIVSTSSLYGGTYNLFHYTLRKLGIDTRFVDTSNPANVEAAIDENTRLVYLESLGNPKNNVDEYEAIAEIAHKHGIPFVIDNTVSPILFRPFDHGADIAVYSLTKFINGHGTAIGGAIVDSGKFNWNNGKFPEIVEPDPSYHGISYWKAFGLDEGAVVPGIAYILKARAQLLRDLGPTQAPFLSWLFIQGLETLPLRIRQHAKNALEVAQWLEKHPAVAWVNYPGLPSHPDYERAKKYYKEGTGAIVGFGVKGGYKAAVKLIDSVKLFSLLANIGDSKSLIIHPASTTHQQLTREEQLATGVTEDFIRLSIGIENVEDIKADLDQALKLSQE